MAGGIPEVRPPSRDNEEGTPCRMERDGEEPETLETVLALNMLGFRMAKGAVDGEEDSEDVPTRLSLMDIRDDDDEFMLSLRSRLIASPEGLVPMFAVLGLMVGNGLGGGIRALVPVLALVPITGGNTNLSATLILSIPWRPVPPVEVARAIWIGGDLENPNLGPVVLEGKEDPEMESRWRFFSSVGTNSSRSREINFDDSKDSSSSNWKVELSRYVVDSVKIPKMCEMGGKVWVDVVKGWL